MEQDPLWYKKALIYELHIREMTHHLTNGPLSWGVRVKFLLPGHPRRELLHNINLTTKRRKDVMLGHERDISRKVRRKFFWSWTLHFLAPSEPVA